MPQEQNDTRTIARIAIFLVAVFLLVAALPWFTLKLPITPDGQKINERIAVLGTYGNMFGMLNSVFSGAALTGAIYAVILQRREHTKSLSDEEKAGYLRRQASLRDAYTARLNATSNLAQTYATIYAGNPVVYDEEVKDIIRKSRGHHRDYVVDLDDMTWTKWQSLHQQFGLK